MVRSSRFSCFLIIDRLASVQLLSCDIGSSFVNLWLQLPVPTHHARLRFPSQFCSMRLDDARKILGRALGTAPRERVFKGYIELEQQVRA